MSGLLKLGEEWERRIEAEALIAAIKAYKPGPRARRQKIINRLLFDSLKAARDEGGENADHHD